MTDPSKTPEADEVLFDPKPQPDEHPGQRAILHAAAASGAETKPSSDGPAEGEDSLQDQARREHEGKDR